MKIKSNKSTLKTRHITFIIVATLVIFLVFATYFVGSTPQTSPNGNSEDSSKDDGNKVSIDPSVEDVIRKGGSANEGAQSNGGIKETDTSNIKQSSGGSSSDSGVITLFTPTKNQRINQSVRVTGSSHVPVVHYRISDDVSGMIGNGQLTVKNGLFSGDLSVNTTAQRGTFEVYSFDSQGREINNINIEIFY